MNIDIENLVDRTTSYIPLIKEVYIEFDKNILEIKNDLNSIIYFDTDRLDDLMNELLFDQGVIINLSDEEKDRWGFKR